jgi:hypothetical protein
MKRNEMAEGSSEMRWYSDQAKRNVLRIKRNEMAEGSREMRWPRDQEK